MAVAKIKPPLQDEPVIERVDRQTLRFARFLDDMSKALWEKPYPPTTDAGVVNYALTSSPALVSTIKSSISTYQTDDQTWLLDINVVYTVGSAVRTGATLSISNVEFLDLANFTQAVTGYAIDGSVAVINCYADPGTGDIVIEHASGTTTTYAFKATGLILEEKSSFAE